MLDEKLERKAAEQASAMAQVARQMAAKGAPVPLRLETVFSKQVGHAPHTPRWRDWIGGETRLLAPGRSAWRRRRVRCLGAVGTAPEHALRTQSLHPHPHPGPMVR